MLERETFLGLVVPKMHKRWLGVPACYRQRVVVHDCTTKSKALSVYLD